VQDPLSFYLNSDVPVSLSSRSFLEYCAEPSWEPQGSSGTQPLFSFFPSFLQKSVNLSSRHPSCPRQPPLSFACSLVFRVRFHEVASFQRPLFRPGPVHGEQTSLLPIRHPFPLDIDYSLERVCAFRFRFPSPILPHLSCCF